MCFNWKVLAGLAVVGLGVLAVSPRLALAVLPFLAVAACPLSVLFMMRGMSNTASREVAASSPAESSPATTLGSATSRDERIAQLQAEIQRLRTDQPARTPETDGSERAEAQRRTVHGASV